MTAQVTAKEQEGMCRAPSSSEMTSLDDRTYLKIHNLRKIKAITTLDIKYKTALGF